jgi:CheY-like chemotaxis protein/HPt (histidine-containing phosphotransfer) domain-containing protein
MTPTVVPDATRALAELRGAVQGPERFDVLISDCQMPDVDGFTLARQVKRDAALATTPVVLLTSMGRPNDVARCRKIGVNAYLNKPVKHSDLLDALVTAFGVSTRRPPSSRPVRARVRPLRVLVAEDNLVNRKLVTRLLQKRGHRISAVDNGRAALEAATSATGRKFDVVLMDVQMPEMNGLEATAAIRQREQSRGTHVPIIALTAHAMPADRERCLAAGMDGYLAKPIDVEELIAAVEAYADGEELASEVTPPAPTGQLAVFDETAALKNAGGDRRLLTEVIGLFQSDLPAALGRVDRAVKRADAEALRLAAHALKGVLATVGSPAGRASALALEQAARSGDMTLAKDLAASLRKTVLSLSHALVSAGLVSPPRRRAARPPVRRPASKNRRAHDKDSRRRR